MSSKFQLGVHRRIERPWAERLKSLAVATGRMLQRAFDKTDSLIPLPVRVVDRRRVDRSQRQ
jgi:hypothetical protein